MNLQEVFTRQLDFQKLIGQRYNYILPQHRYEDAIMHITRAMEELHEAIRTLPYSQGGLSKGKNPDIETIREEFYKECVDAFLFMVNAMNSMDSIHENVNFSYSGFVRALEAVQTNNFHRFGNKIRFRIEKEAPIIIIDGPDGVGKTTLCARLSAKFGIEYVRMHVGEDKSNIEDTAEVFNRCIAQIKTPMILDRGYPSSMAYTKLFDRDPTRIEYLKTLFDTREVLVFIITADRPYRSDDYITDIAKWVELRDIYIELAKQNRWIHINNNESLDDCENRMINALQY